MFWIIISIILFLVVVAEGAVIYKLLGVQEDVEDRINDSMDVLNTTHEAIDDILHKPLFHDSPEIQRVLKQIEYAREAVHAVAVEIAGSNEENIEDEDEEEYHDG